MDDEIRRLVFMYDYASKEAALRQALELLVPATGDERPPVTIAYAQVTLALCHIALTGTRAQPQVDNLLDAAAITAREIRPHLCLFARFYRGVSGMMAYFPQRGTPSPGSVAQIAADFEEVWELAMKLKTVAAIVRAGIAASLLGELLVVIGRTEEAAGYITKSSRIFTTLPNTDPRIQPRAAANLWMIENNFREAPPTRDYGQLLTGRSELHITLLVR